MRILVETDGFLVFLVLLLCYSLISNTDFCRVYCPELEAQARGPPAGEFPYSRKWTFQESHLLTVARDSRPPWSTLTPSPLTPSSFSLPHSRESTESEHTGMSKLITLYFASLDQSSKSACYTSLYEMWLLESINCCQ